MKEEKNFKYRLCPSLGQRTDPGTALSYPSGSNRCAHARRVVPIDLGHQEEFCLTSRYPSCKEYARDPDAALPGALDGTSGRRKRKRSGINKWVLGSLLLGLGLIVTWQSITRGKGFGELIGGPTGNPEPTETSAESTSTFLSPTATPPLTPTSTPTYADTATLRPTLGLETPLGIDHKFEIHQIQAGESLELIASRHGTTGEALRACNYRLSIPLLTGWAIVIPLNFVELQGFPAFEVYSVSEEISLEELAIRLAVDLNDFKYYNAIDDGFMPRAGDWFLVPRAGSPTR